MRGALVVLLLLRGVASAAPSATTLFHEGVDALRDGDFVTAADRLSRSSALEPRAATFCNLALAYDRWAGHEAEAAAAYRACADRDTSGRFREHATVRARELEQMTMHRPPPEPVVPPPVAPAPRVVAPSPPAMVEQTPPPRRRYEHHLAIGAGVTGALALGCLGGGIGLEVAAQRDLERNYTAEYDHAHALARAGIGLYVGAGALGVTSIALGVLDLLRARR